MPVVNPLDLDTAYSNQLKTWIDATGLDYKDVAKLTEPLDFGLGTNELKPYTFSRTVKNRPQARTTKHNLYRVIGVLFALDIVTQQEVQQFFETVELDTPSNGDTWTGIWKSIEDATPVIKENAQEIKVNSISVVNTPDASSLPHRIPVRLIALIGVSALVLVTVAGMLITRVGPQSSVSCLKPVVWSNPAFIRNEGFSLYLPAESDLYSSIPNSHPRTVYLDRSGLWVGYVPDGSFDGVSFLDRTTKEWTHCPGLGVSGNQNANAFVSDNGSLLVATDGRGVGRLIDNRWEMYTTADGLPTDTVYDFLIDEDGTLYAATSMGVARFLDERWKVVYQATAGELNSDNIIKLLDDSAGNRWFGTIDQGITRLAPDGTWSSHYRFDAGLRFVRSIAEDTDGNVWFGTDLGGLVRFKNEEWQVISVEAGSLPHNSIQDVEYDAKYDRIWIATPIGAFYSSDLGQTWTKYLGRNTWAIEIGCQECAYDHNHIWFVFRDEGLGHSQLPPDDPIIDVISVPERVQLRPGEAYVFSVEVRVLKEDLDIADGLFSIEPTDANLFGAWERIPIPADTLVEAGQTWTFSNVPNPIIAPAEPGVYQLAWRVWQNGRYVTDPIIIEFEVVDN